MLHPSRLGGAYLLQHLKWLFIQALIAWGELNLSIPGSITLSGLPNHPMPVQFTVTYAGPEAMATAVRTPFLPINLN